MESVDLEVRIKPENEKCEYCQHEIEESCGHSKCPNCGNCTSCGD